MRRGFGLGLAALSFAACSASVPPAGGDAGTTDGGDAGITGQQACSDFATAYCTAYAGCSAYEMQRTWGTVSTCESQETQSCVNGLAAPATSRTPTMVEICAQAESSISCADLFANITLPQCAPQPGGLDAGATCVTNFQCQSTFCQVPTIGSLCGTCQPLSTAGSSCATLGCSRGFICGTDTQTCLAPVTNGGICADSNVCEDGLVCFGFDGGNGSGNCVPAGDAGGVACGNNLTAPACDTRQGLTCFDKTCVPYAVVSAPAACGEFDAGPRSCNADAGTSCIITEQIVCEGGGDCVENATVMTAACVSPAAVNGTCDIAVGPGCLSPTKCILDAGTTGTCQFAEAQSCGS